MCWKDGTCAIALDQRLLNYRMLKKHSLLLSVRPTRHHNLDLRIEAEIMMIKICNLDMRDCIVVHSYPSKRISFDWRDITVLHTNKYF